MLGMFEQLRFMLGVEPRASGAYFYYVSIASGDDNAAENARAKNRPPCVNGAAYSILVAVTIK